MRIASLLPSATEIVCAVTDRASLVGVSHECDYPSGVEGLPILTRPRVEFPKASGDIDRAVRELVKDTLAVYEVRLEELREANPEVVVTQALCDVCAVSLDRVQEALRELARSDVEVVSLSPTRLGDIWEDVRRVGRALGLEERANEVAASLEERCRDLGRRTAELPGEPTVLTVEWLDPVMIGGTWMPELVELAGGRALVTEPAQHAPTLSLEELSALDPDVVLIKPCGFELERSVREIELLRKTLPWDSWKAVREDRVFLADGNAFFNRPGPRLVESLEILAACLYPSELADLAEKHRDSVVAVGSDLSFRTLGGGEVVTIAPC